MGVLSQKDINILFQQSKQFFVKLYLLNRDFQTVEELQGELISGSITIDADSDIRRVSNLVFLIKDQTYFADHFSKIWLDKFVDLRIGIYYNKTGEILWYPLGTYIFNDNSFYYNSTNRTITCSLIDLMGHFTGMRSGMLNGSITQISSKYYKEMIITDIIKGTVEKLGNIKNYVITPNSNEDYLLLPYDLEFGTGVTVYEILKRIADIYPGTEFYFDTDRVFRWDYISMKTNDMIFLDDDIISPLIINESLNKNFRNVKNCIEIWGNDDLSARLVLVDKIPQTPNPNYTYMINPDSSFTVDKLGEIWDVKHMGDYDMIYSEELALDRAKYELYHATSAQDTLTLDLILIPFLDVNKKISYKEKVTKKVNQYITKKISFDIASATMQVNCVRFNPEYYWL